MSILSASGVVTFRVVNEFKVTSRNRYNKLCEELDYANVGFKSAYVCEVILRCSDRLHG
jgi:hypothetical protein